MTDYSQFEIETSSYDGNIGISCNVCMVYTESIYSAALQHFIEWADRHTLECGTNLYRMEKRTINRFNCPDGPWESCAFGNVKSSTMRSLLSNGHKFSVEYRVFKADDE